jgi:Reverse transcriptase (RNA-dependent DNA polymerase)
VAKLIYTTEKAWEKKKHLGALFLDVKDAFDYMAKNRLLSRMKELNIPSYPIKWTNSFLSKRRVQLVINGFIYPNRDIITGVPQGSPVFFILFIIYLSNVFDSIEARISEITALSFADDIALLAPEKTIKKIQESLAIAGEEAIL